MITTLIGQGFINTFSPQSDPMDRRTFRYTGLLALSLMLSGCAGLMPVNNIPTSTLPVVQSTPTVISHPTSTKNSSKVTSSPYPSDTPTPATSAGLKLLKTLDKLGGEGPAYSPDGKFIAVNYALTVEVYDRISQELQVEMPKPEASAMGGGKILFSPDGSLLAANVDLGDTEHGPELGVYVWKWTEERLVEKFEPFWEFEFSPDGQVLAMTDDDRNINLWNFETKRMHVLIARANDIAFSIEPAVLASAEGTPATGGPAVRLWDINTGKAKGIFLQPEAPPDHYSGGSASGVAFSPDGKFLAAIVNDRLELWSTAEEKAVEWPHLRSGVDIPVTQVTFSPKGILAVVDESGKITMFNSNDGQVLGWIQLEAPEEIRQLFTPNFSATFSPDGTQLLVGGSGLNPQIWQVPPAQQ